MFCDEVQVTLKAGSGGKGAIAFRREKFVPRGGPNGGDGGKGGSIYLEANENINTLAEFNTYKIFRARSGENGKGKNMGGKDAQDLILQVPVGTMIFDKTKSNLIADLTHNKDRFLAACGGKGGYGNAHFKSSTRQTPRFAELGEPGEEKKYVLELKLVADVGIIGLPSVGKSTLLSRISNARPKIADYPFTTLIPNLGLVNLKPFGGAIQQNFLACDLPGLIENAHKGKGLGIQFLKHVARNKILVHLIDVNSPNPSQDYKTILNELKLFDKNLPKKPQIVAFNKIDTINKDEAKKIAADFKKRNRSVKCLFEISCVVGEGLKKLLWAIWKILEKEKLNDLHAAKSAEPELPYKIFRPALERDPRSFSVKLIKKTKKTSVFEITGRRIEQIAVMTDFSNPEAVARVYDVCEKMGINKELRRNGAKFGDEIMIKGQMIIYRW
ncbi:GTPase ObgE [Candidatus Peregrinibacteria bacterium]|nr:GTPase ObgE [Candidatus Peregrinibacteria bacterium]